MHNPFIFVGKTMGKSLQSLSLSPGAVQLGIPALLPTDPCQIQFVFQRSHQLTKISSLRGSYDGKGPAPTLQGHREGIRMDH